MFAVNGPSGPTQRNERRVKKTQNSNSSDKNKETKNFFTKQVVSNTSNSDKTTKRNANSIEKENLKSSIFKGCVIGFNGRTGNSTAYDLAKLVKEHGGNVQTLFSRRPTTHIVAQNLTQAQVDKLLRGMTRSRIRYVKPDWLIDSIHRKKRQPESQYLIYQKPEAKVFQRTEKCNEDQDVNYIKRME